MNPNPFSTVACRAVGLALLLFGFSYLLPLLLYSPAPAPSSGWTNYAPLAHPDPTPSFFAHHLSFVIRAYVTPGTQFVCGLLLLVFGRPVGALLARGFPSHTA